MAKIGPIDGDEEATKETSKDVADGSKETSNGSKLLMGRRNPIPPEVIAIVQSQSQTKLGIIAGGCLLTLLIVIIIVCSASRATPSKYSDDEAEAIVALHNRHRKEVIPGPPIDMQDLVWSDSLAAAAQAWAEGCEWKHGNPHWIENVVVEGKPIGGGWGQNLFKGSAGVFNSTTAINAWKKEVEDYNYPNTTCSRGKVCAHYTQLVWASTKHVGCGWTMCRLEKTEDYIVCNYHPEGNYRGEKPYKLK